MADRQRLMMVILVVCMVNGIFSPYLNLALPVAVALMPELFPRTIEWVLFWSSILLASATLLFTGVPAALYERLIDGERPLRRVERLDPRADINERRVDRLR